MKYINKMLFAIAHEETRKRKPSDVSYSTQFGIEYRKCRLAYRMCHNDIQDRLHRGLERRVLAFIGGCAIIAAVFS